MKYGKLHRNYQIERFVEEDRFTNIGETAIVMAMEGLYREMGVKEEDLVEIFVDDISSYDGEYVLLPINIAFIQDLEESGLHKISNKIIPVFIGLCYNSTVLDEELVSYFKKYEPIGCRDEQTMCTMRSYGIDAYLNGCITLTLPKRPVMETQKKIFFVDVPKGVKKYIPEEMKKDICFIKQEIKESELPAGMNSRTFTEYMIDRYRREAKMVVTSRFHGACIAIALGIPVIVINETLTFRFSFLKRLVPFYTRDEFAEIDWYPEAIDIEEMKERMKRIVKKRIGEAFDKYTDICDQSAALELKEPADYGLIDYYDEAIEYIEKNWTKEDNIRYGFWGVNNNAEYIYSYLSKKYPNAKMEKIYDTYKKFEFHGINSETPDVMQADDRIFIFVTTFVAGYVAEKMFLQKGIGKDMYFLCNRGYVEQEDL